MKRIVVVSAFFLAGFLHAYDPRVTALSVANILKKTADNLLQSSSKSVEEVLTGRRYRTIREKLIENQKALQIAINKPISLDPIAAETMRAHITILNNVQNALLQKLRAQWAFPSKAREKLIKEIENQLAVINKLVDTYESIIHGYSVLVDKVTMEGVNRDNPYRNEIVHPEPSTMLRGEEVAYNLARDQTALPAVEKLFGSKKAKIAFVGTGGGYRAMMLTLGYLMGLEAEGWLDALYYISSLSGSTWFLAPWIYGNSDRVSDYRDVLRQKIERKALNIFDAQHFKQEVPLILNEVFWPKAVFVQPIGSVDIYGSLLASVLFSQFDDRRQSLRLSEQWEHVKQGNKPFPLYVAVSYNHLQASHYDWVEFSPLSVTHLGQKIRIPAYAFGSQFRDGQSLIVAPEQSMGYLLGIFGSAYAVNMKDIERLFVRDSQVAITTMSTIRRAVFNSVFKGLTLGFVGSTRALPADNYNPFKGYAGASEKIRNQEILTLVDAGIDYNIPIMPVIDKNRGVNVIIIGESSGGAETRSELVKMIDDLKRTYGYEYQTSSDYGPNFVLCKAPQPQAPLILYISYLDDLALRAKAQKDSALKELMESNQLASFSINECFKKACGTFNFDYLAQDFDQLLGVAALHMRYYMPMMKQAIKDYLKDL